MVICSDENPSANFPHETRNTDDQCNPFLQPIQVETSSSLQVSHPLRELPSNPESAIQPLEFEDGTKQRIGYAEVCTRVSTG